MNVFSWRRGFDFPDKPSTSVPPTAELNSYIKITLLTLCSEQSFSVAQVFTGFLKELEERIRQFLLLVYLFHDSENSKTVCDQCCSRWSWRMSARCQNVGEADNELTYVSFTSTALVQSKLLLSNLRYLPVIMTTKFRRETWNMRWQKIEI